MPSAEVYERGEEPSLLVDRLPGSVTVLDREIPIYRDFRRWILFIERLAEKDGGYVKIESAARLVCVDLDLASFDEEREVVLAHLLRELSIFAHCGEERGGSGRGGGRPIFDFEKDDGRIYASFLETYGIDLSVENLHWWKFMALLRSLPPESDFMRTVRLRECDTSEIEDDALRKRVRRAKAAVRL